MQQGKVLEHTAAINLPLLLADPATTPQFRKLTYDLQPCGVK